MRMCCDHMRRCLRRVAIEGTRRPRKASAPRLHSRRVARRTSVFSSCGCDVGVRRRCCVCVCVVCMAAAHRTRREWVASHRPQGQPAIDAMPAYASHELAGVTPVQILSTSIRSPLPLPPSNHCLGSMSYMTLYPVCILLECKHLRNAKAGVEG